MFCDSDSLLKSTLRLGQTDEMCGKFFRFMEVISTFLFICLFLFLGRYLEAAIERLGWRKDFGPP